MDLGNRDALNRLADIVRDGDVDGIVNNAGLVRAAPLGGIAVDTLDEVLRVTLHSALVAAQAALVGMTARGWGRIVNISSLTVLGSVERTRVKAE